MYMTNQLYCVSDGSFYPDLGRGSHAWIMSDPSLASRLIGAGPVDGDPRLISAYRPELHGILANLIMLRLLTDSYGFPAGALVTLVCDNEAATFELEKLVADRHYHLDPQQTDCDILL
mmetsp:Transcript_28893/g.41389  ORF Transcript_28893/g.41389 Transcript_28893/m.41389 type:complete len:118 (+) Transcript_28893:2737-3090(+)